MKRRPARAGRCLRGLVEGGSPIGKRRPPKKSSQKDKGKELRVNDRIKISPVRLIDQNEQQVGIVDTSRAKQMARDAGYDLVEVAPNARPVVCRIMDYGKWKYAQRKKEQKAKAHAKQTELKEVRLRPSTDDHDLHIKTEKAREFLAAGHKVQFTILFKGRQMAHRDIGLRQFDQIAEAFSEVAKVDTPARLQGRRMTMILSPGRAKSKSGKGEEQEEDEEPPASEDAG